MRILRHLSKQALTYHPLTIHSTRCVRAHSPLAQCSRCRDVCPVNALVYTDGGWQVADHCTHCGFCVTSCPMEAFAFDRKLSSTPDDEENVLLIGCVQDDTSRTLPNRLHCFQGIRPEDVAAWLTFYDTVVFYANCSTCQNKWFPEGMTARLSQLHIPFQGHLHLIDNPEVLAQWIPEGMARRVFLTQTWQQAQHSGQNYMLQMLSELTAPLSHQDKEEDPPVETVPSANKLKHVYAHFASIADDAPLPYPALVNRGCHFCAACVHVCPTQALSLITTEDNSKQLRYSPRQCTRCGLCLDVCLDTGFMWGEPLQVSDYRHDETRLLAKAPAKQCDQCKEVFHDTSGSQTCTYCLQKKRPDG